MATTTENGVIKPAKPKIDLSKLPPLESAADFMKRNVPPLQHIIEGIATEGVGLLAAREKTGKSWLCYQAGEAVASGGLFLGHKTMRGACLYFDFENPEPVRQERLKIMFPQGIPDNLFFINPPPESDPWIIGEGFEDVLSFYLDQRPDTKLVVLDTLDIVADDQKRNEAPKKHAYRNIRKLKAIAQAKHICIICVMHFRKTYDPDDFMSNISGSNGWAAAADYAIGITKKRGETDAVFQTDGRTCKGVELSITQDTKNMKWTLQGPLEEMMERRRVEGFRQSEITKAVIALVKSGKGKWSGTSQDIIKLSNSPFDDDIRPINASAKYVTAFIRGTTDLFYKECFIKINDRNANNSSTTYWDMQM